LSDTKLIFRTHALRRMFERDVRIQDIRDIIDNGEIIKNYDDDMPYPSKLILGYAGGRPLHIVAAENEQDGEIIIITVYEPDADKWDAGYRRRKKE